MEAGECTSECTPECEVGAQRCTDEGRDSCVAVAGCPRWRSDDCPETEVCVDGSCRPRECRPECPETLRCEAGVCVGHLDNLTLNEIYFNVSGNVTVDGSLPTLGTDYCNDPRNHGQTIIRIEFREPTKDYTAYAGIECGNERFDWDARLPAGTYEVRVSAGDFFSNAEPNAIRGQYLVHRAFEVSGDLRGQNLNETPHRVSGELRVNGFLPTRDTNYCRTNPENSIARVRFTDNYSAESFFRTIDCENSNFEWSIDLPPGTYTASIERGRYTHSAGVNIASDPQIITNAFVVNRDVPGTVLNAELHEVAGTFSINGVAPRVNSEFCDTSLPDRSIAVVHFSDPEVGHSFRSWIRCGSDFAWRAMLPTGNYEVRVERAPSPSVPLDTNILRFQVSADPALSVTGANVGVALNYDTHRVSGTLRVNGRVPSTDPSFCLGRDTYSIANIVLRDRESAHEVLTTIECADRDFEWSTVVPEGVYDIRVERSDFSFEAGLEIQPQLVRTDTLVSSDVSEIELNQVLRRLSGSLLMNGSMPTVNSDYCTEGWRSVADVIFRDINTSDEYSSWVQCEDSFSWEVMAPPGTYDIIVKSETPYEAGINLFYNEYVVNESFVVFRDQTGIVLNETSHSVSGNILVNGATPTLNRAYCEGNPFGSLADVFFIDRDHGTRFGRSTGCDTGTFTWNRDLPPGVYEVRVDGGPAAYESGVNLLRLEYIAVGALRVP